MIPFLTTRASALTLVLCLAASAIAFMPTAPASHCMRTSAGTEGCTITCQTGVRWAVIAGFSDGGFLDAVTGQVLCDTTAITGCTAERFPLGNNVCTSAFANGVDGAAKCRLTIHNAVDGVPVQNPFAVCYDPADPSQVLPTVVVVVPTPPKLP